MGILQPRTASSPSEQRSQAGCIAARMQRGFRHGLRDDGDGVRRLMVRLVRFACRVACVLSCPVLLAAGPEPPRELPGGDASIRASLTDAAENVVLPGRCRECHAAEFDVWETTEHATAFDTLHRGERAKGIAGRLDLRLIRRSNGDETPACLSCHYTPVVRRGRLRAGAGVTCESCHGPARDWVSLHGSYGVPEADFQKAARLETAAHRTKRIADSTAAGMRRSSHLYELGGDLLRVPHRAQRGDRQSRRTLDRRRLRAGGLERPDSPQLPRIVQDGRRTPRTPSGRVRGSGSSTSSDARSRWSTPCAASPPATEDDLLLRGDARPGRSRHRRGCWRLTSASRFRRSGPSSPWPSRRS